jgi:hypothetical protein
LKTDAVPLSGTLLLQRLAVTTSLLQCSHFHLVFLLALTHEIRNLRSACSGSEDILLPSYRRVHGADVNVGHHTEVIRQVKLRPIEELLTLTNQVRLRPHLLAEQHTILPQPSSTAGHICIESIPWNTPRETLVPLLL